MPGMISAFIAAFRQMRIQKRALKVKAKITDGMPTRSRGGFREE